MSLTPAVYKPALKPAGLFRALGHRNYRLFFLGQGVSLIGNWMTSTAAGWLIFTLTRSEWWLGFYGFANQFPAFLFTVLGGVVADRLNRRRVLLATQVFAMVQSLALAALCLTGVVSIWYIIALSVLQGVINGFDIPTRQAFVLDMVTRKEDLGNAIALNSMLFNSARIIGPSLAGLFVMAVGKNIFGFGMCFLVDGLSYSAVIGCLLAMHMPQRHRPSEKGELLHGIREGFVYAYRDPAISAILLLVAIVSCLGMPYMVMLPYFAEDVLGGGSFTLPALMISVGLGAIGGAFYLASHPGVVKLGRKQPAAAALFAAGVIGFSQSNRLWFSMPMLLLTGAGMMTMMASCNTVLQTISDDDKRGRIISLYTMAFVGMMPIGNLFVAFSAAHWIGTQDTLLLGGLIILTAAAIFTLTLPRLRAHVQPVYARFESGTARTQ
jgi:MFS family permease